MKLIKLVGRKSAMVSDEDHEYLSKLSWEFVRNQIYLRYTVLYGGVKMKKVIAERMGISNKNHIYHNNNNPLDCQRKNLIRWGNNHAKWNRNKANLTRDPHSKYKGVSYHNKRGYWVAAMTFMGKKVLWERADTELEAALIYGRKAIKLHGRHCNLDDGIIKILKGEKT